MKFEFYGDTYDTDKPIYVLGYTIGHHKYWFSLQKENVQRVLRESSYNISCKKLYVMELDFLFDRSTESNEVVVLKLNALRSGVIVPCDYDRHMCIIGHSAADCKKKFKEWRSSV